MIGSQRRMALQAEIEQGRLINVQFCLSARSIQLLFSSWIA